MRVKNLMSSPAICVKPGDSIEVARSLMRLHGIQHLAVLDGDRLVGVVSESDLENAPGGTAVGASLTTRTGNNDEPVSSRAMHRPICVAPDERIPRAANLMRSHAIGCLPVVDGDAVVGMLTNGDLLEHYGRHSR